MKQNNAARNKSTHKHGNITLAKRVKWVGRKKYKLSQSVYGCQMKHLKHKIYALREVEAIYWPYCKNSVQPLWLVWIP